MKTQKHPPTKTIAVDVDGTLHNEGVLNMSVVQFCERQKANGFTVNLWSARGKKYAQAVAAKFGVTHLFDDIVSKPGYVLDDQGWNWIKYTQVIRTMHDVTAAVTAANCVDKDGPATLAPGDGDQS
jgi:hydroxymethylpyrimidine pyrophosphatase-like HAD family hydrolase